MRAVILNGTSRPHREVESKDLRLPLLLPVLLFVISQRSGEICFSNPRSLRGDH
jgi:hypothetical protein